MPNTTPARQHGPEPRHPIPATILAEAYPYRSTTECGHCGLAWVHSLTFLPRHGCNPKEATR